MTPTPYKMGVMIYAHDGTRQKSVATVRAGDGSFLFLSRPALDFAISGGVRGYESLFGAHDLETWVRAGFHVDVAVSDDDFAQALRLRRAIWQLVTASLDGKPLPRSAIVVVNAAARFPPMTRQLAHSTQGWDWHTPVSLDDVASSVARDAIELFAVEDRTRLRTCAARNCALVFFDDSRSGRRRWCAAQRCGDRTRARDYRARKRTPSI